MYPSRWRGEESGAFKRRIEYETLRLKPIWNKNFVETISGYIPIELLTWLDGVIKQFLPV